MYPYTVLIHFNLDCILKLNLSQIFYVKLLTHFCDFQHLIIFCVIGNTKLVYLLIVINLSKCNKNILKLKLNNLYYSCDN